MYEPITYSLLKSKNACHDQLALFKKHFGVKKSIPLTKVVANKFAAVFDINWAAKNLLNPSDLAEYNKVYDPAWAEYEKVSASAIEFVRIYKRGLTS